MSGNCPRCGPTILVHTMCLHGDHHQIAEYIEHHDHRYQPIPKENQTDE